MCLFLSLKGSDHFFNHYGKHHYREKVFVYLLLDQLIIVSNQVSLKKKSRSKRSLTRVELLQEEKVEGENPAESTVCWVSLQSLLWSKAAASLLNTGRM